MSSRAFMGAVFFGASALAACGGGSAAPPAGPTPAPPPPVLPGPVRSYAGTRTIEVHPAALGTAPAATTYAIAETEQDVTPGNGAPAAATFDRHITRTYSGPPPPDGVYLQSATIDEYGRITAAGLELTGKRVVEIGHDVHAERTGPPATQFTDTRMTTVPFPPGAVVLPAVFVDAQLPFPLAYSSHVTEQSAATSGFVGATAKGIDLTRTVNADGSFDETGSAALTDIHAIHQHADGSATSHDQLPGFSLRDVSVSAPVVAGFSRTLTVTTQTQGRTVGNPPIVTTTYTTPVWYEQARPAAANVYVTPNSVPDSGCGLGSARVARAVNVTQARVDVTSGTLFVENDISFVDAAGVLQCRVTNDSTIFSDVTTGAYLSQTVDTTIIHLTANAPGAGVSTGAVRRTN